MSQDANMRVSNSWLVYQYDELNRVIQTGTLIIGLPFAQLLSNAYGSINYPGLITDFLTQYHYDDYADMPVLSGIYDNSWYQL